MERHRKGGDVGMAFLPEIRPRRQVFLPLQRISNPTDSALTPSQLVSCRSRYGGPGRRSDLPNNRSRVIATALRTER